MGQILLADPDEDEDGWYWFQDCQDDDSERAPLLANPWITKTMTAATK